MQVMRERKAPMLPIHTLPQMVHLRWGNTNIYLHSGMLYLKSILIFIHCGSCQWTESM